MSESIPHNVIEEIRYAKNILENPGLFIKIANHVGRPVEYGLKRLPAKAQKIISRAVKISLEKALKGILSTMNITEYAEPSNWRHRSAVMLCGAAGGAFDLPALPIELPVSTLIMLRSIADHAGSQGLDLADYRTQLDCLSVFAMGGNTHSDDAAESSYYLTRAMLAMAMAEAVEYLSGRAGTKAAAPALIKLIETIAARFNVTVSEKAMGMLIPAIGAVGGMAINTIFLNHFQKIAEGHFIIRRLEKRYGEEVVREIYNKHND